MSKTLVAAAALACASCGTDFHDTTAGSGGAGSAGGGSNANATGDLPCDVQTILSDHCTSCHGDPPSNGAPMSLVTYDDLIAPGTDGQSIAQRALVRMTSTTMPMPPAPSAPVAATDIATFQAWVDAAMPPGTACSSPDPLNAPPTCTSGKYWTAGDDGSAKMHPGDACISCHASHSGGDDAPQFTIAGTVFPTGHEPDDCDGVNGGAQVVITDANNATYTLTANSVGNFYTSAAVVFPIHAKVVANGQERDMGTAQTSGDCNSCHTQNGANMAPGRIVLP
ncbi:MAG TPA: hypothetical protein VMJ10_01045 [Kofleriaceae bacterium]|nr:hypothetical protein [Kofleriaceae bacterium]